VESQLGPETAYWMMRMLKFCDCQFAILLPDIPSALFYHCRSLDVMPSSCVLNEDEAREYENRMFKTRSHMSFSPLESLCVLYLIASIMPLQLRPEIRKLFLSIIDQPHSFTQPNGHTSVSFRQQMSAPHGTPNGTWIEAGSNKIASIPVFSIVLDANVGPYGTADDVKSLEVCPLSLWCFFFSCSPCFA
jgi:hypothetical protein